MDWKQISTLISACLLEFPTGMFYVIVNIIPYASSYMKARVNDSINHSDFTWLTALSSFGFGVMLPFSGLFKKYLGYRGSILLAIVIQSGSMALSTLALQHSLLAFNLTFGLFPWIGAGLIYCLSVDIIYQWFTEKTWLFSGLTLAFISLAGFIFAAASRLMINPDNVKPNTIVDQDRFFTDDELLDRVPRYFWLLGLQALGFFLLAVPGLFNPPVTYEVCPDPDSPSACVDRSRTRRVSNIASTSFTKRTSFSESGLPQEISESETAGASLRRRISLTESGLLQEPGTSVASLRRRTSLTESSHKQESETGARKKQHSSLIESDFLQQESETGARKKQRTGLIESDLPQQESGDAAASLTKRTILSETSLSQQESEVPEASLSKRTSLTESDFPQKETGARLKKRVSLTETDQPQHESEGAEASLTKRISSTETHLSQQESETANSSPIERICLTRRHYRPRQSGTSGEPLTESSSLLQKDSSEDPITASTSSLPHNVKLTESELPQLNYKKMLRQKEFYILWVSSALTMVATNFILSNAKAYPLVFNDNDSNVSLIVSFGVLVTSFGKIFWCHFFETQSFKISNILYTGVFAASIQLLELAQSLNEYAIYYYSTMFFVSTFCLAGTFAVLPTVTALAFGRQHFATNFGIIYSSQAIGSLVSALMNKAIVTKFRWGWSFTIAAAFPMFGFITTFYMPDDLRDIRKRYIADPKNSGVEQDLTSSTVSTVVEEL